MNEKHDSPEKEPKPAAGQAPNPNVPEVAEDTGSRALSEALQSSFGILKVIMVILVIIFFASGVFTVPPQQKAIVLRFGEPVGTGEDQLLGPGLHWAFPYPIDEVIPISVGEIQTVTSRAGWYVSPEAERLGNVPFPGSTLNPATEGYAITGDGNIIHIRATLRYRVSDPVAYALKFVNASNVVESILDSSLFHASAKFSVDEALRLNVFGVKEAVLEFVREEVRREGVGIAVEDVDIRTAPPRQVEQAFEQVLVAELERRKAIDDAQSYANRIISTAQGEANHLVNEGETEADRLVQEVRSDAQSFLEQLPYYRINPDLLVQRLQVEALHRILTNKSEKVLVLEQPKELRVQLSREPQSPRQPQQQETGPGGSQARP